MSDVIDWPTIEDTMKLLGRRMKCESKIIMRMPVESANDFAKSLGLDVHFESKGTYEVGQYLLEIY